jgi:nitroreductase
LARAKGSGQVPNPQPPTLKDLFVTVRQRRAVKHCDPAHHLADAEVERLISKAMLSPTSFDIQHWRFVVVQDPELRWAIRAAGNDQAQMTDASVLVVMTADVKACQKQPERYWRQAPEPVADLLLGWKGPFHQGREALQRDEAMRSIGMVMLALMRTAQAMGYDSCPMISLDHEQVAKLIRLPADHVIGPMVAIGRSPQAPWPRLGRLPLSEDLVRVRFAG